jgi:hypothetical protein
MNKVAAKLCPSRRDAGIHLFVSVARKVDMVGWVCPSPACPADRRLVTRNWRSCSPPPGFSSRETKPSSTPGSTRGGGAGRNRTGATTGRGEVAANGGISEGTVGSGGKACYALLHGLLGRTPAAHNPVGTAQLHRSAKRVSRYPPIPVHSAMQQN